MASGPDDSVELCVSDILAAGAGASSPQAGANLAEEGPSAVREVLMDAAGIPFDRELDGELSWGQEAADSRGASSTWGMARVRPS